MNNPNILCIGDAAVDVVLPYGKALRERAGRRASQEPDAIYVSGGTIGNTAAGLTKLGLAPRFITKVGTDWLGEFYREDMAKNGVDGSRIAVDPERPTFQTLAVIGEDGERIFFNTGDFARFSTFHLTPEDVDWQAVDDCDILLSGGSAICLLPLQETVIRALQRVQARGGTTVFDLNVRWRHETLPQGIFDAAAHCVAASRYVLGSREEFAVLWRGQTMEEIAGELTGQGKTAVVRDGPAAVEVSAPEGHWRVPTIPTQVVDTVGAGDHFNSGFAAGLAAGHPVEVCSRWGCAAASYSLRFSGGKGGPTMEQLQQLVRENYPL